MHERIYYILCFYFCIVYYNYVIHTNLHEYMHFLLADLPE